MNDYRFWVRMKEVTGARVARTEVVVASNELEARMKLDQRLFQRVRYIKGLWRTQKPADGHVPTEEELWPDGPPALNPALSVREVLDNFGVEVEARGVFVQ